jgi:lipopolysaccharide transport system permease protein
MISLIKKLIDNRNLLKNLVLRDLKHRYVGSIGGILWSVIHPVVLLVSYTFVFAILNQHPLGSQAGSASFPIFFFCGFLPWLLFQDTVTRSCSVITDNAPLITKTVIPAEMLPISVTLSTLAHHAIGISILLVVLAGFSSIHLSALYILLYMPLLLMLAQGVGWIVAGLHVFVRDTIQALQILMFLWFWFTPVIYSSELFPERLRLVLNLNPMAVIVTGYRNSLLHLAQPNSLQLGLLAASSLGIFVLGAFFFRRTKAGFADVL